MSYAPPELIVVRGGGDIATGIVWRLTRPGWPVVVTELARPLTVRRSVALSTAVTEGAAEVEGMRAELVDDPDEAARRARNGIVAVLVSPDLPTFSATAADVVVDARLAKRDIDTRSTDAPLVIGVGPGFTVGTECDAVIETRRGHHLGRCLWAGSAAPDTGVPGTIGGRSTERVLRAPTTGTVTWRIAIGDQVAADEELGEITAPSGAIAVHAPFAGVARGLIAEGTPVPEGLKIGDLDPRADPSACFEISDKALAVAGGVQEAVLTWMAHR